MLSFVTSLLTAVSSQDAGSFNTYPASVFISDSTNKHHSASFGVRLERGIEDDSAAAKGPLCNKFSHTSDTNDSHSAEHQAYAAGFLEGYITGEHIINNFLNLRDYFLGEVDKPFPDVVLEFLKVQYDWFEEQAGAHDKSSEGARQNTQRRFEDVHEDYWQTANFVLHQFKGEVAGIQQYVLSQYFDEHNITEKTYNADPWQIATVLNAVGDLLDVVYALLESNITNSRSSTDPLGIFLHSMCTALVKVSPDFSDLRFGHSAWFT
ncbi:phospholipase B domain containing, partial [Perkinsus chesapeaki]